MDIQNLFLIFIETSLIFRRLLIMHILFAVICRVWNSVIGDVHHTCTGRSLGSVLSLINGVDVVRDMSLLT